MGVQIVMILIQINFALFRPIHLTSFLIVFVCIQIEGYEKSRVFKFRT